MLRKDLRRLAAIFAVLAGLLPLPAAGESGGIRLPAAESVTELSVTAGSRSFVYRRSGGGMRVNGGEADEEIFSTLMRQICGALQGEAETDTPAGEPLLTVQIGTGNGRQTVCFYADGADRSRALVLSTGDGGETVLGTEAWRVGTILLACEGTQIPAQDEEPGTDHN